MGCTSDDGSFKLLIIYFPNHLFVFVNLNVDGLWMKYSRPAINLDIRNHSREIFCSKFSRDGDSIQPFLSFLLCISIL